MIRLGYLAALAGKSAWNRRGTLFLIVFSISLSVTLLLGIERIRTQIRESFVQSVSGTDLIIGARGSQIQLMLYAVFHLGGATNNIGWDIAQKISKEDEISWTIPVSLGDSHKGYPVVATNENFFRHFRFQGGRELFFAQGKSFDKLFEVVLGAEAAKNLNYIPGQKIALNHGNSDTHLTQHADKPFTVTGILAPTGTPVDRSFYISLNAMEALHLDWQAGVPVPGLKISPQQAEKFNLEPKSITALLVGLKKRGRVFAVQRMINEWKDEPLMAVMPGIAMDEIWQMLNTGEQALLLVSGLVTITGLAGLAAVILAGLGERRRELAILRSAGARPSDILVLLACEGLLLMFSGIILGLAFLSCIIAGLGPFLADRYGFFIYLSLPGTGEWLLLAGICLSGFLASLIPAFRAYQISLSDGLTVST
jgi:ABC-type transport system, involved in lipoprotein release, permease component